MKTQIAFDSTLSAAASRAGRRRLESTRWGLWAGLILAVAAAVPAGRAGSVAAPYEVGTWEGFRPAAISYTFDDDCSNQYALAVPMFNAAGFKLTLFTVTSWLSGWAQVQAAAAAGHEIGSHTVTHANLGMLTDAQQAPELTNSQNLINANVPGQKCVTIAYPNCVAGDESLISQYYIAGRTCSGQIVPSTPSDFLQISCMICGSSGSVQTLQNFTDTASSAYAARGWCVYLIHGIDSDGGYSPLPSAMLQSSVNYFSANQDRFWVQAFGNVVRYIRERNAATVAETSSTDTNITLQVTDGLNDSIYNFPITLRRPLPANWVAATITQAGTPIYAQVVTIGSTNYVMFDVVPDVGDVILSQIVPTAEPVISVTPPTLDFGSVAIGSSADRSFYVQNTGGGLLSGGASASAPFSVLVGSPYNLTTNQITTVTLRYTPASAGGAGQDVSFTGADGAVRAVSGSGYVFWPSQLSGTVMAHGLFSFSVSGMAGTNYIIQASTNLLNWWPVSTGAIPSSGSLLVSDPSMTNQSRRFYRSALQ
jgi:oligosaccharide reducing-end xylanase